MSWRRYPQLVLATAAVASTATVYGPFFGAGAGTWLVRLVACAVAAAALAVVANLRRLRMPATAGLGVLGFALVVVPLVLAGALRHGLPALALAGQGLAGGWASMLSVHPPAPASARMLMTPAAVTWIAGYVSGLLVLRTRGVLGPALPAVAAEAVALPFVANQPGDRLLQAGALLVLLLALVALRADPTIGVVAPAAGAPVPRRAAVLRRAWAALAVLAVAAVAVAVTVAQPVVRGSHRADPRALVQPPLHVNAILSPLGEVGAQRARPAPQTLFTAAPAVDGPVYAQTAALDTFDGARWTAADTYLVAGPALAGDDPPGASRFTERVTLAGLSGPFLPAIGRPVVIDADFGGGVEPARIGFDPDTGILVTDATRLAGAAYTVTGVRRPAGPGLADASAGAGAAFARDTVVPSLPDGLASLSASVTGAVPGAYGKAQALAAYLRAVPYDPATPPGESYAAVQRMIAAAGPSKEPSGSAGAAGGDIEQHVAAFAMLARAAGLPSRIAVGYRLPAPDRGMWTVTSADSYAWDQVYFQGYGWVDIDPTDTGNRAPQAIEVPVPTPAQFGGAQVAHPPLEPLPARAPAGVPAPPGWPPLLVASAIAGGVCAVAGLLLGANAAAKALLRRRRRRGGPGWRTAGAWLDATGYLREAGVALPATLTAREVAERAHAAAGRADGAAGRRGRADRLLARAAPALDGLADRVTAVVYGPGPHDPAGADAAWVLADRLRRELHGGRFALARAVHLLRPVRLGRVRRPRPTTGGKP